MLLVKFEALKPSSAETDVRRVQSYLDVWSQFWDVYSILSFAQLHMLHGGGQRTSESSGTRLSSYKSLYRSNP